MNHDDIERLQFEVRKVRDEILEADTEANFVRLKNEAKAVGCTLKRDRKQSAGYSFTTPDGSTLAGITLRDVDGLLKKIAGGAE